MVNMNIAHVDLEKERPKYMAWPRRDSVEGTPLARSAFTHARNWST